MSKFSLVSIFSFGLLAFFSPVHAANYGAGNYGGGPYSVGVDASTGSSQSSGGTGYVQGYNPYDAAVSSFQPTSQTLNGNAFNRDLFFGVSGADVKILQDILISQGYLSSGKNTGYFGSLTQAALARYQKAKDITPAYGYFGPKTRVSFSPENADEIAPVRVGLLTKTLSKGMKGPNVSVLQQILKNIPNVYPQGLVSGYFGDQTLQAVKKFQMKFKIVSSPSDSGYGLVGPKTREKLNELGNML